MVKNSPAKRSLLLVSEDLQQEPLSTMIYNNKKDIVECCAINIPWLAGVHKEQLKDIAVMTGATLVDNEFGLKLEDVTMQHFGSAKMIKVDVDNTHIVGGNYSEQEMDTRFEEISARLKRSHLQISKECIGRDLRVCRQRLQRYKLVAAQM